MKTTGAGIVPGQRECFVDEYGSGGEADQYGAKYWPRRGNLSMSIKRIWRDGWTMRAQVKIDIKYITIATNTPDSVGYY